jgi:hypothetical protein
VPFRFPVLNNGNYRSPRGAPYVARPQNKFHTELFGFRGHIGSTGREYRLRERTKLLVLEGQSAFLSGSQLALAAQGGFHGAFHASCTSGVWNAPYFLLNDRARLCAGRCRVDFK